MDGKHYDGAGHQRQVKSGAGGTTIGSTNLLLQPQQQWQQQQRTNIGNDGLLNNNGDGYGSPYSGAIAIASPQDLAASSLNVNNDILSAATATVINITQQDQDENTKYNSLTPVASLIGNNDATVANPTVTGGMGYIMPSATAGLGPTLGGINVNSNFLPIALPSSSAGSMPTPPTAAARRIVQPRTPATRTPR